MVRANPLDTPWGAADLEALVLAPVPPHSLLVPKVSSPERRHGPGSAPGGLGSPAQHPLPPG
jgi:hypothetical protein